MAEERRPTKIGSLIDKVWYLPNLRRAWTLVKANHGTWAWMARALRHLRHTWMKSCKDSGRPSRTMPMCPSQGVASTFPNPMDVVAASRSLLYAIA